MGNTRAEENILLAWNHAGAARHYLDQDGINARLRRLRRLKRRARPGSRWSWLISAWIDGLKGARGALGPSNLPAREYWLEWCDDVPTWALPCNSLARLGEHGTMDRQAPEFSATWDVIVDGRVLHCDVAMEHYGSWAGDGPIVREEWHTWRGTPARMDYLGVFPSFAAARAATHA